MILKQLYSLKNQKQIYLIEEDDGEFLYRVNKISKYALSIRCRKAVSKKTLNGPDSQVYVRVKRFKIQ